MLAFAKFLVVVAGAVAFMLLTVLLSRAWIKIGSPDGRGANKTTCRSKPS